MFRLIGIETFPYPNNLDVQSNHKYVAIRVHNAFLFRNNLSYLGSIEQQTQNLPN